MFKEHRLIGVTISSLNAQRQSAGDQPIINNPHVSSIIPGVNAPTNYKAPANVTQGSLPPTNLTFGANAINNQATGYANDSRGQYSYQGDLTTSADAQARANQEYATTGSVSPQTQAALETLQYRDANPQSVATNGSATLQNNLAAIERNNPGASIQDLEAMKQSAIAKYQTEQQNQQSYSQGASQNATENAGAAAGTASTARFTPPTPPNAMPGGNDLGSKIQQLQAAGYSRPEDIAAALNQQESGSQQGQYTASTVAAAMGGQPTQQQSGNPSAPSTGSANHAPSGSTTTQGQQGTGQPSATVPSFGSTAFDTYVQTLSPQTQSLIAPFQAAMKQNDASFSAALGQDYLSKLSAQNVADFQARNQQNLLTLTAKVLDTNKDQTDAFLQNQFEAANKNLLAQTAQTKQWLSFQEGVQTRQMQRDRAQNVMDMAFAAAVGGGTLSSSSSAAISKADAIAEQNINDMQTQFGLKATDADLKYNSEYTAINNTFMQGVLKASQDYRQDNLTLLGQEFATEDARAKAYQTATDKFTASVNDFADKKAAETTSIAGDISTANANLARITYDRQNQALQNVQDIWSKSPPVGGQPSQAVKNAVNSALQQGLPADMLQGFLTGEPTISSIMPMWNYQGQQAMSPSTYANDPRASAVQQRLAFADASASADQRTSDFNTMAQMLAHGDYEGANKLATGLAVARLPADDQKTINGATVAISQAKSIQNFIAEHANDPDIVNQGILNTTAENARKWFAQQKDPTYRQFAQDLGFLNADILHSVYGSRLTETEIGFADNFLPQVSNERIGDISGKLNGLINHYQQLSDTTIDLHTNPSNIYTGSSSGLTYTSPSSTQTSNQSPATPSNKDEATKLKGIFGGSGGGNIDASPINPPNAPVLSNLGPITQHFETPVSYTASGMHHAVDIAMPEGTKLPSLVTGVVSQVSNTGDLGTHVTIKQPNGYTVTYAHLSSASVKSGEDVTAGQALGLSGHTGLTSRNIDKGGHMTGDHVHIQVVDPKGNLIDPEQYFSTSR